MYKIQVEFPMSEQLIVVADFLEERGFNEVADTIRYEYLKYLTNEFQFGEIIRYSEEPSALMQIDQVESDMYLGTHYCGGKMYVFKSQCSSPSKADQKKWNKRDVRPFDDKNSPLYNYGEIIRYGEGSTALMEIAEIRDHGRLSLKEFRFQYYGIQLYGGYVGAYEKDCSRTLKSELEVWNNERQK